MTLPRLPTTFAPFLFPANSVTGSPEGWKPVTDGYVALDVIHTEVNVLHPFSLRSNSVQGKVFQFDIVPETRSRLTQATFLQWHLKGSKLNYGLQLINEESAIKVCNRKNKRNPCAYHLIVPSFVPTLYSPHACPTSAPPLMLCARVPCPCPT